MCYLYVFYSFYNTYACFVTYKNYFFLLQKLIFQNHDQHILIFVQLISFAVINLYLFLFFSMHFKRFPSRFLVINFTNHFYKLDSIFLTIHFKHFDFIEWIDLNSNSSNLIERSSISDFLVFLMCLCILFISLKIFKCFSYNQILFLVLFIFQFHY